MGVKGSSVKYLQLTPGLWEYCEKEAAEPQTIVFAEQFQGKIIGIVRSNKSII